MKLEKKTKTKNLTNQNVFAKTKKSIKMIPSFYAWHWRSWPSWPWVEGVPTCLPGRRETPHPCPSASSLGRRPGDDVAVPRWRFPWNRFPRTRERDLNCKHMSPQSGPGSRFPAGFLRLSGFQPDLRDAGETERWGVGGASCGMVVPACPSP